MPYLQPQAEPKEGSERSTLRLQAEPKEMPSHCRTARQRTKHKGCGIKEMINPVAATREMSSLYSWPWCLLALSSALYSEPDRAHQSRRLFWSRCSGSGRISMGPGCIANVRPGWCQSRRCV